MTIGQQILEYIVRAKLMDVQDVEGTESHVIVWSANSEEQLTALVQEWSREHEH